MGIFSSIGNALFGGPKKRGKVEEESVGTVDQDPWSPVIPHLEKFLANSAALYGGGAPQFSPMELAGYEALNKAAASGGAAIDPAIKANNATLSGKYLDPKSNPYILDIAKRAAGEAGAVSNASFAGAGRTGSGLAGYYAGKGAADAANDIFYENYGDERNRMLAATGMAPSLEAGRYLAPQALISAGQNVSARPFDLNAQYGGILANIAGLGQQGTTTNKGSQLTSGYHGGLIGKIADSFTNKLFG